MDSSCNMLVNIPPPPPPQAPENVQVIPPPPPPQAPENVQVIPPPPQPPQNVQVIPPPPPPPPQPPQNVQVIPPPPPPPPPPQPPQNVQVIPPPPPPPPQPPQNVQVIPPPPPPPPPPQPPQNVQVIPPPPPKALACSVESMINLENDQRRLYTDIIKMEAQAEEITASFIGGITYTVTFSGAGLLFGNPIMPCGVVMTFVFLILFMFVLAITLFFIVMVIKTERLEPMLSDFNVRRLNIIQGARESFEVENNRNLENHNLLHPTASHQSVVDRLAKIVQSEISITLKKFYCQIFWLTVIYVGIYGSILVYVAWHTFCTIRCGCVIAALDAVQVV